MHIRSWDECTGEETLFHRTSQKRLIILKAALKYLEPQMKTGCVIAGQVLLMNGWFGKKDDEEAKRYFRTAFQLGNNDLMWMVLLSDMEGKETTSLM